MNVRWMAVLTGFAVHALVTTLAGVIAGPSVDSLLAAPDPARPDHLLLLAASVLSTGLGGYVAARMAMLRPALHGLLVGVLNVLLAQLAALSGAGTPPALVLAGALSCLAGALGGLLARSRR
ncbi:MAG TPA: DUF3792 family protein [Roseiflexaceae bacterium]|nr:DUF3792 family protein [Roseiflexaceae bacterium]